MQHDFAGNAAVKEFLRQRSDLRPGSFYIDLWVEAAFGYHAGQAAEILRAGVASKFVEEDKTIKSCTSRAIEAPDIKGDVRSLRSSEVDA